MTLDIKKWLFKFLMDNVQMDEINLKPNRQYFGKKNSHSNHTPVSFQLNFFITQQGCQEFKDIITCKPRNGNLSV
jgi:hypothetical protein